MMTIAGSGFGREPVAVGERKGLIWWAVAAVIVDVEASTAVIRPRRRAALGAADQPHLRGRHLKPAKVSRGDRGYRSRPRPLRPLLASGD